MPLNLYTIGHSTHSIDQFIELLSMHSVTAVGDVRSRPYSQYNPQFNREGLRDVLKQRGIEYVFLGEQLGARSKNPRHYSDGKVQYHSIATSSEFRHGLARVRKGLKTYRIALLCAEKDPIVCHRAILICRHLRISEIAINHIRGDGTLETNSQLEQRLLHLFKFPDQDLF